MENATVDLDFWFLIRQGAISTYPLLVCSILMLGVVIERLYTLRGAVSATAAALLAAPSGRAPRGHATAALRVPPPVAPAFTPGPPRRLGPARDRALWAELHG